MLYLGNSIRQRVGVGLGWTPQHKSADLCWLPWLLGVGIWNTTNVLDCSLIPTTSNTSAGSQIHILWYNREKDSISKSGRLHVPTVCWNVSSQGGTVTWQAIACCMFAWPMSKCISCLNNRRDKYWHIRRLKLSQGQCWDHTYSVSPVTLEMDYGINLVWKTHKSFWQPIRDTSCLHALLMRGMVSIKHREAWQALLSLHQP